MDSDNSRRIKELNDKRLSLVEKTRQTDKGRRDLGAVESTFDAMKMIEQAMEEAHISRAELAEKLEISTERVDEILDVYQGNIRITTLSRILNVCGFKLNISSTKI